MLSCSIHQEDWWPQLGTVPRLGNSLKQGEEGKLVDEGVEMRSVDKYGDRQNAKVNGLSTQSHKKSSKQDLGSVGSPVLCTP